MAVDIKVPSPGESITEGTLSRWLKPNGAFVKMDDPVFELESDKAAIEVNAPVSGVLTIAVPEGSTVQVGAVVGRIDENATAPKETKPPLKGDDGRKIFGIEVLCVFRLAGFVFVTAGDAH